MDILETIQLIPAIIRHIFFPPRCAACGNFLPDGALCSRCRAAIILNRTFFCGVCRARLPDATATCHKSAPYILGAAGNYEDDRLRSLVHALKFRRIQATAEPIAGLLADYLQAIPVDLSRHVIMPIPLSSRRKRERGFNQTERIALHLSRIIGMPFFTDRIKRIRHTARQSETKNVIERKHNVEGAFKVIGPIPRNIILIDDVTTSGATFRAAASAMRASGASKIIALAVAKA